MTFIKILLAGLSLFLFTNINGQIMPSIPNTGGSTGLTEDVTPMDAPPHRGVVKPAGKYYIEIVVNWMLSDNNAVFYLLKSNGAPITNDKITCRVEIERTDEEGEPIPVKKWGNDAFAGQLKADEAYHLKVTFQKKKRTYSAVFKTNEEH